MLAGIVLQLGNHSLFTMPSHPSHHPIHSYLTVILCGWIGVLLAIYMGSAFSVSTAILDGKFGKAKAEDQPPAQDHDVRPRIQYPLLSRAVRRT
jgi:hypothetical protein